MLLALLGAALASTLPDLDHPLQTGAKAPEDAAVVIGNEDYYTLPDVPFAFRDAELFRDWLLHSRGVPANHVSLKQNLSHAQMAIAIEQAAKEVGEGGTLWVYFAGHGTAVPTGQNGETARALVGSSAEADARTLDSFTLSLASLDRQAQASKAARVVVVLDACYANGTRGGGAVIPGRPMVPVYALPASGKLTVWSAASPTEVAGAYEPAKHGLFTWLLVGGLRGWADGAIEAADGSVDFAEINTFMASAVPRLSEGRQNPEMKGEATGMVVGPLSANKLDFATLPGASTGGSTPTPSSGRRRGPLLIAGIASAAVGGTLVGLGAWKEGAVGEEISAGSLSRSEAESARSMTNGLYGGGYAGLGVGLVLGVTGLARPVADSAAGPTAIPLSWSWGMSW